MSVLGPVRSVPPRAGRRTGEYVALRMLRDAHAWFVGHRDPVYFARGTRIEGSLVRHNTTMRRLIVALPEGWATFDEEDVELI